MAGTTWAATSPAVPRELEGRCDRPCTGCRSEWVVARGLDWSHTVNTLRSTGSHTEGNESQSWLRCWGPPLTLDGQGG